MYMVKNKEIELTSIGCVVGICASYSQGCMLAKLILAKINGFFNTGRGEQSRLEGAGGR